MSIRTDINRVADDFTRGGGQPRLVKAALNMIANWPGGLIGLMDTFRGKGHGQMVDSWISRESNEVISVDELRGTIGPEPIDNLARQAGISADDAAFQLSSVLPDLISGLVPHGDIPNPEALDRRIRLVRDQLRI